ncbi:15-hydroxyprostaglandin dehydrogenase [NAD(+)]-like [Zerene cesonia]|uniref:15-hydroxyprostaglandin dehydrogenase [NAD(+)]-like n=1 Tax=Zerene cesonia TaxID=33412 RepID=UPI0018E55817|nr:15-hydroxyprostaglandin dehydrogenase [NAD(+)]-like [Zerene cesonia]
MPNDLKDKVVLITGAAIGIGSISVPLFLEEGVKHIAITDIDVDSGKQLQQELNSKYPGRVSFIKCDVTNDEELFAAYDQVLKQYGYIDFVVNNAGLMNDGPKVYKKAVEVNVTALVTSSLKAWDLMRKDKSGRGGVIVNIASIAGIIQNPFLPVYNGTKSAVLQFSNCLGISESYEKTGVKVIAVCYGATNTSLLSKHKMQSFSDLYENMDEVVKQYPAQSAEDAAKGLVEACKRGESASTWLVADGKPAKDITPVVQKAYALFHEAIYGN